MKKKLQSTGLNRNFGNLFLTIEFWCKNPWRKYSLLLIIFLSAFVFGSSIGMINGVLALMDPVAAFFTIVVIEILVRSRRLIYPNKEYKIILYISDCFRIGFVYGLFFEGFKLL